MLEQALHGIDDYDKIKDIETQLTQKSGDKLTFDEYKDQVNSTAQRLDAKLHPKTRRSPQNVYLHDFDPNPDEYSPFECGKCDK